MNDNLAYFKEVNAQKQIDKLTKKFKDKRIVIYGAGAYFQALNENFDLSGLNIIGISDKKFIDSKDTNFDYPTLTPEELKTFDYDIILVALYDDTSICDYLEFDLLLNTPNENKRIYSIIEPTIKYIIKVLLFG